MAQNLHPNHQNMMGNNSASNEHARQQATHELNLRIKDLQKQINKQNDNLKYQYLVMKGMEDRVNSKFKIISIVLCFLFFLCLGILFLSYNNKDEQKTFQQRDMKYLMISNEKLDLEIKIQKENTFRLSSELTKVNSWIQTMEIKIQKENKLKLSSELAKLNSLIQTMDLQIKNEKDNTLKSFTQIAIKLKNSTQRLDLEIKNEKENTMKYFSQITIKQKTSAQRLDLEIKSRNQATMKSLSQIEMKLKNSTQRLDLEIKNIKATTMKYFSQAAMKLKNSTQILDLEIKNRDEATMKSFSQIQIKLKNSTQRLDLEIKNRKENTMKMSSEISKIHDTQLTTASDINLLHRFFMNEDIAKRYYPIMIKNSRKVKFQLNKTNFEDNYAFKNQNTITKINYEKNNVIVYTQRPLITSLQSYFSVRIEKIQISDISIGVFTDKKLSKLQCGYCEQQTMYYIYSNNANIYHGKYLSFFTNYQKSTIPNLKEKDEITVFYDHQWKRVIFYVNQIYVGHILLKKDAQNRQIYPFFVMGSKNNQILLL